MSSSFSEITDKYDSFIKKLSFESLENFILIASFY